MDGTPHTSRQQTQLESLFADIEACTSVRDLLGIAEVIVSLVQVEEGLLYPSTCLDSPIGATPLSTMILDRLPRVNAAHQAKYDMVLELVQLELDRQAGAVSDEDRTMSDLELEALGDALAYRVERRSVGRAIRASRSHHMFAPRIPRQRVRRAELRRSHAE